jgi:hypothetical protein
MLRQRGGSGLPHRVAQSGIAYIRSKEIKGIPHAIGYWLLRAGIHQNNDWPGHEKLNSGIGASLSKRIQIEEQTFACHLGCSAIRKVAQSYSPVQKARIAHWHRRVCLLVHRPH